MVAGDLKARLELGEESDELDDGSIRCFAFGGINRVNFRGLPGVFIFLAGDLAADGEFSVFLGTFNFVLGIVRQFLVTARCVRAFGVPGEDGVARETRNFFFKEDCFL